MLLLLSRFSRVWPCATHRQQPTREKWILIAIEKSIRGYHPVGSKIRFIWYQTHSLSNILVRIFVSSLAGKEVSQVWELQLRKVKNDAAFLWEAQRTFWRLIWSCLTSLRDNKVNASLFFPLQSLESPLIFLRRSPQFPRTSWDLV